MFEVEAEIDCTYEEFMYLLDPESIIIEGEMETSETRNAALVCFDNTYFIISATQELPESKTIVSGPDLISIKHLLRAISIVDFME